MYICVYMYIVYHCLLSEIQTKGMSPNSLSVSMTLGGRRLRCMMLIFMSHITSVKCDIKVRKLGVSVTISMMLREFGESSCISCMYVFYSDVHTTCRPT